MLSEEKFLYLCCLELIVTDCEYTEKKEKKSMFKKKKKKEIPDLLFCPVWYPVRCPHCNQPLHKPTISFCLPQTQACPSPPFSLQVTFFRLSGSGLQCLGLPLSAMCIECKCAGHEGQSSKTQPFPSRGALLCWAGTEGGEAEQRRSGNLYVLSPHSPIYRRKFTHAHESQGITDYSARKKVWQDSN